MTDITLIREALGDPTIAAYPDFVKAVSDACDQLERVRSDREYIIGSNDGVEIAIEQAAQDAEAEPEVEGVPSPKVIEAMRAVAPVLNARAACATTKQSIANAIRALAATSATGASQE